MTPLKRVASVQTGLTLGKTVNIDHEIELPYLRVANVQVGVVDLTEVKTIAVDRADMPRYLLRPGDVLMTEGGDIDKLGRGCLWNGEIEPCMHQNHVFAVRCSARLYDKFLVYVLDSPAARDYFYMTAKKTTNLASTNSTTLLNFNFALPPLAEQHNIVNHLDEQCAAVDVLIAKQEQLIATLREDRTATITHAVTKGLDPDVEMKDSGVEWLGDVPRHWTVTRLGRLCRSISDGPHFSPSYVDEGVMFLSARNVRVDGWSLDDAKFISEADFEEFSRRVVPEVGDVLYTKGGTTGVARAVDLTQRFQVWVHVAVLKLHRDLIIPEYLAYSLNSSGCYEQSQLYTRGATNQDLGLTRMIRILLALPPIDQQREIINFLDPRCEKIDTLITKANEVIDTLREYRSALITDAVTGKIDVRGAA